MEDPLSIRDELRGLSVFVSTPPSLDYVTFPDAPSTLFRSWLRDAIAAGQPEPHAMTLSTVDADGAPDARVLILKDQIGDEWHFASSASSAKGRQLHGNRGAALTFYWPVSGRQVRIRGRVDPSGAGASAEDFLARGSGARSVALVGREGAPLADRDDCAEAVGRVRRRLRSEPDLVADHWTLYSLRADEVEFWQADVQRMHHRILYSRLADGWGRGLLWP